MLGGGKWGLGGGKWGGKGEGSGGKGGKWGMPNPCPPPHILQGRISKRFRFYQITVYFTYSERLAWAETV